MRFVRIYSDLDWQGKLVKLSIPLRKSPMFQATYLMPTRFLRFLSVTRGAPSRFHYRRLTPNYEHYWLSDSDAVASIDWYEAQLWFRSRGDECLNCRSLLRSVIGDPWGGPLIVRIPKP